MGVNPQLQEKTVGTKSYLLASVRIHASTIILQNET
jgi:hypothetical protein